MKSLFALIVLVATGCATTTKIVSTPSGAAVIDDTTKKDIGKTPMTYETKMWIWESQKLTLKAAGRKDKTIEVKRSEVDLVPMIGGVCLSLTGCGLIAGVPLILAGGMKLPAETTVKMDAGGTAPPTGMLDDGKPDALVCMRY